MRWRIERDYQDLKQEFGLAHYEWPGLARLPSSRDPVHRGLWLSGGRAAASQRHQKNALFGPQPALPENYVPWGRSTRPAARSQFDLDITVGHRSDSGQ